MQLFKLISDENNIKLLNEAVHKDLRKPSGEFYLTELAMVRSDLVYALNNLDDWVKRETPKVNFLNRLKNPSIVYEPKGIVLIIGAWNYPVQLTFQVLVSAIASGNCAVLKPSEVSSHTAHVIQQLTEKYMDPRCVQVIQGGVKETTVVLEQRFDHILYTGNSQVARIVMAAAAKHLTPVTLELGGKSPTIVDSNTDFDITARRIVWGMLFNNGQTCIRPDYVLALPNVTDKLVTALDKAIKEFYGENIQKSEYYGRIINNRHFNRLRKLIEESKGKIAIG